MKLPLTKYGLPQIVVFPVILIIVMLGVVFLPLAGVGLAIILAVEAVLVVVLAWVFSFFRDPQRSVPVGDDILVSPADGVISDIDYVDNHPVCGPRTLRIGIFLSIFNVHINRVPCAVKIGKVVHKDGRYKNALDPESARVNESNDVEMRRVAEPCDKLLVRQISGAIARRIVCKAREGQEFAVGEKFGMIKFGSRTELYLPAGDNTACQVKVGQKVKAGLTILVRYENGK